MSINRKTRALLAILTPILAISAGVLKTQQQAVAAPQTFTVTNTNNAGSGSLRQAIEDANSNGNPADQDVIEFDILGAGDHVIQPSTSLSITQSVVINGFTQSDSSQNTVLWPGPLDTNIRVAINNIDSGPILVTSNDVTLQGLAIYNSLTSELSIDSSPNFKLYGSHIDMDTTGYMGAKNINANAPGISLTNSPDAVFGDGQAQNRNIFGHCKTQCIKIEGGEGGSSSGAIVRGNYFGVGADGITDANNVRGLTFYNSSAVHLGDGADDSIVGGSSTGQGNSFERLNSAAVWAQDVSGVTILGNRFVDHQTCSQIGDSLQYDNQTN